MKGKKKNESPNGREKSNEKLSQIEEEIKRWGMLNACAQKIYRWKTDGKLFLKIATEMNGLNIHFMMQKIK